MVTIHEKTAKRFDTLGLGALSPASCVVSEKLNGIYELKMEHPYDAFGKWKRIEQERIIYASTPFGHQPFRIYNIEPDMGEGIVVNARHIFYDLLDNQSWAVSFTGTADNILNEWKDMLYTEMPFTFETDMTHEGEMKTDRVNPVQALLSDDDDMTSFVRGCGGEILRDHFNVSVLAAIGQDRDVAIRYGKNLIGLEVTEDAADVKTRFLCYDRYGRSAVVDSPYIGNYVYPKIYTLEDDYKTIEELKAEAHEMLDSGADLPMVNIKVDFVELTKTVEYKDYAPLEQVFLGDTVTVINQKMNFAKKAKVISYEWNCLLDRYDEVELGDFMPSLAASVTSGARSGSVASSASATAASVAALLNSHMNDKSNPHEVTAAQTGGSGSSTDTDADAVLELLAEHEENKENPHEVTLAQVGFSSGTDDPDDANGKDNDVYLQIAENGALWIKQDGAWVKVIQNGTAESEPEYDLNTLLLLHGESMVDSSIYGETITNNGVTISTDQSKFGGSSMYFSGSATLRIPAMNFGTGDFTVDFWMRPSTLSGYFLSGYSGGLTGSFGIGFRNGTTIGVLRSNEAWDTTATVSISTNTWTHVAFVRKDGVVYIFVNGKLIGSGANVNSYATATETVIGAEGSSTYFEGYIDEYRISNVARWTSDFSVPTEPYEK